MQKAILLHKCVTVFIVGLLLYQNSYSQASVGIGTNTPHPSAALDISSANKGLLIPRLWLIHKDSSSPIDSDKGWNLGGYYDYTSYYLMVFNLNFNIENGLTGRGFYYWNGHFWVRLSTPGEEWDIQGNTANAFSFLGTTDNQPISFRRNNKQVGHISRYGTRFGYTASDNYNPYNGNSNTSFGAETLLKPGQGGLHNLAMGAFVLQVDSSGGKNVGIGAYALATNKDGVYNTALGHNALYNNKGSGNTAIGSQALYTNINGSYNAGIGYSTSALSNLFYANAVGAEAGVSANNCLVLGGTGAAVVKVGIGVNAPGADLDIKQHTDSFGIRLLGSGITAGWTTYVDANGNYNFYRLQVRSYINGTTGAYTAVSDGRMKKNLYAMEPQLQKLMQLEPKTYRYIDNPDNSKLCYGFLAQDVEAIYPEFVKTKGEQGMKAIAYSNFGVIAVKTIQEQQAILEEQDNTIAQLRKRIEALEAKSGKPLVNKVTK